MDRVVKVSVGAKGRVVLPAELRRRLGLRQGSELLARIDGERLVLESREAVLARLQRYFAHVPAEASLVDELLAERRAEARRDHEQ